MHVGAADSAPGFDDLAHDIAAKFSVSGFELIPSVMSDWNADWDTIYPFSAVSLRARSLISNLLTELCTKFLSPYKLDLPLREEYFDATEHHFTVSAVNDTIDSSAGTRSLTLKIGHPGIIWTGQ